MSGVAAAKRNVNVERAPFGTMSIRVLFERLKYEEIRSLMTSVSIVSRSESVPDARRT